MPDLLHAPRAARHETWAFRAPLALAALAAIEDASLPPEPGTAAGDHLAGGLVPVALAGVLGWASPRLRAGLRGTAAIVCGVLAITAGVADGLRHVIVDRLAGDDMSAMLAAVAGVALVAPGVVTPWRARPRGERPLPRPPPPPPVAVAAGLGSPVLP